MRGNSDSNSSGSSCSGDYSSSTEAELEEVRDGDDKDEVIMNSANNHSQISKNNTNSHRTRPSSASRTPRKQKVNFIIINKLANIKFYVN